MMLILIINYEFTFIAGYSVVICCYRHANRWHTVDFMYVNVILTLSVIASNELLSSKF